MLPRAFYVLSLDLITILHWIVDFVSTTKAPVGTVNEKETTNDGEDEPASKICS